MADTSRTAVWKKRFVVSSFILKHDEAGKPRVALFQRSEKVSTYQHHLAPISGTIEPSDPSPDAAAWREISEETTLTQTSLTLLRQGKSYSFSDVSVRREWTVFPFLFRLRTPADEHRIQIDWEHEGWGWHDPDEVIRDADQGRLDNGVPRLAESLRRVWFETDLGERAGKVLADGLEKLARDYESGARELAGAALRTLRGVVAEIDAPEQGSTEEWWSNVRFAAWHLWKNGRESMGAAIMGALLAGLAGIEEKMQKCKEGGEWHHEALRALDARIKAREDSGKAVLAALESYLSQKFPSKLDQPHKPLSILTLSESSTIRHALQHLATASQFVLDLRVLESRPLYEGISLAGSLAESFSAGSSNRSHQHKITLYSDASAALAAIDLDIIMLGADRIASSGAVSNKTGSLAAVLSARHVSPDVKVLVVSENDKIAPPGRPEDHVVEDNDPSQLSRAWEAEYNSVRVRKVAGEIRQGGFAGVEMEVRNIFFEWVPARLTDTYITESGELHAGHVKEYSEKLEVERERLFENL
ncbi:hypothetical protein N0V88_007324 [Collariella sp. IMI 366227]|nr:hypothetical protein N0V88_007324 [Collariella sp. IMI 366227]